VSFTSLAGETLLSKLDTEAFTRARRQSKAARLSTPAALANVDDTQAFFTLPPLPS